MMIETKIAEALVIERRRFGTLADGRDAFLYTLTNRSGMRLEITDFGATVVSLLAPDRNGHLADVVLGYDSLDGYVNDKSYLGVTVGRCANRIARGRLTLNGKTHPLTINDGKNHLHGGAVGFHKVLWNSRAMQTDSDQSLILTYRSADGDEGYPGNVAVQVIYTLNDVNELTIQYAGTTDQTTILNPTHHSYFNLTGSPLNTILDHQLHIEADSLTPVDKGLITTGEIISVANTPMDFRTPTAIGARINEQYEQLIFGKGYDHNWVLRGYDRTVRKVAELYDPKSGRFMTVLTDQPGLQFYSGNFLNGTVIGKRGVAYQYRKGLCLEAQHYPDSPNKPQFPSVVLKPGEVYRQTTIYKFSTKN
jgi:aldose 1-epimerase